MWEETSTYNNTNVIVVVYCYCMLLTIGNHHLMARFLFIPARSLPESLFQNPWNYYSHVNTLIPYNSNLSNNINRNDTTTNNHDVSKNT